VTSLRTERLVLTPLGRADEADHTRAQGDAAEALRDIAAAEAHWRDHGFGGWAVRDRRDGALLGGAELRFAGDGIDGIAPDEVEAGWWVTASRRKEGIASEAMRAALGDLWQRRDDEHVTAYIAVGNEPSHRLAARLGFVARGPGRGRFGEPMTIYVLQRSAWLAGEDHLGVAGPIPEDAVGRP
jgi:RimJ/RimL family protein N-acetyltransferase